MSTYTVYEPPQSDADYINLGVEFEFVKDSFSWLTAICPPLGFLASGIWLMAVAHLAGAALLGYMLHALKVDPSWIDILFLITNIYLGFEVSALKQWMLDQKGWHMVGVVNGKSITECERRFFESWLPQQTSIASDVANGTPSGSSRGVRF